jgi:hypothetical protein
MEVTVSFEPMLNRWVLIPIRMLWKTRRGDPRKPLAGPNGQKIARLSPE